MLIAALGTHMAEQGRRVVLIDMNTGMRCLDMLFGQESRIVFDLGDVLSGSCGLDRAIVRDKRTGVDLIAAWQFGSGEALNERTLGIIVEVLCLQYDYVLLDAPTGICTGSRQALSLADTTLLVTEPDDLSLRDAERMGREIDALGRPAPWLILNRIVKADMESGLHYSPQVCAQVLDMPVQGVIPEDSQVRLQWLLRMPRLEGTAATRAVEEIADRLEGRRAPLTAWEGEAAQMPDPPPEAVPEHDTGLPEPVDPVMTEASEPEISTQPIQIEAASAEPMETPPEPMDDTLPKKSILAWLRRS